MLNPRGQNLIEYTMLIGVVTLVLVYMGTGIKRGLQSLVKVTADQVGNQQDADQQFNNPAAGYMESSKTTMQEIKNKQVLELGGGGKPYARDAIYNDYSQVFTNSITNGGFTPEAN